MDKKDYMFKIIVRAKLLLVLYLLLPHRKHSLPISTHCSYFTVTINLYKHAFIFYLNRSI